MIFDNNANEIMNTNTLLSNINTIDNQPKYLLQTSWVYFIFDLQSLRNDLIPLKGLIKRWTAKQYELN